MAKTAKLLKEQPAKKRIIPKIIYASVLVLLLAFGIFFFVKYQQVNSKYKVAIMTVDQKNQQIVARIGKLIDLPKNETPEIALFPDKKTFSGSTTVKAFYANAEKGDYVVAYKGANQTIIYRDATNKIIKSGEYVYFTAGLNPIKLAILAPTDQQQAIANKINGTILNADIVAQQQPKVLPAQSYVVDVTGTNAKAAKELADKLGLPVGQLPEGETKPEGATLIVVIAGAATTPAP